MNPLATLRQALFRWRSDGSGPIRLGQRRIFIVPSRHGLLFALALVVMLIGAINYTLALGHALVFLLAGLAIVGMIHTFRNLYDLRCVPGRSEPVFVGETAHFPLTLDNRRRQPRLALTLEATGGPAVHADLAGESTHRVRIPLPALRRGWLALPRIRLSTRYPLGLFTAWAYLQPDVRCLVYPRPLDTPLPRPSATPAAGRRQGEGGEEDFAGLRERQPADSLRHVAWKAAARQDGSAPLLTKQFAGGMNAELLLDWQDTDASATEETRLGILAGWVLAAEAQGIAYGLRLPGAELPVAGGPGQRESALELLALFRT